MYIRISESELIECPLKVKIIKVSTVSVFRRTFFLYTHVSGEEGGKPMAVWVRFSLKCSISPTWFRYSRFLRLSVLDVPSSFTPMYLEEGGKPMAVWVCSTLDSIPPGSVLINPNTGMYGLYF